MKKIIIPYLLFLGVITVVIGLLIFYKVIDFKEPTVNFAVYCFLFGAFGGIFHCLRGYYLHTALLKDWDKDWNVWYFIRPIVSGMLGLISLFFVKTGLLIFQSNPVTFIQGENVMGYFVVAFIAGYNVQNFLAKLEEISEVTLGIKKKDK